MAVGRQIERTDQAAVYSIEDLGELSTGLGCQGNGIDPNGVVVGIGNLPGYVVHAIARYPRTLSDLGTLGGDTSFAWAINNQGTVVGSSDRTAGDSTDFAFVWQDGRMLDLNTLITARSGWI